MFSKLSSFVGWFFKHEKRSATRNEKLAAKLMLSVCDFALKGAIVATSGFSAPASSNGNAASAKISGNAPEPAKASPAAKPGKDELIEQRKRFEPPSSGMRLMIKTRRLLLEVLALVLVLTWWRYGKG